MGKKKATRSYHSWTTEELDRLAATSSREEVEAIAKEIGVSLNAAYLQRTMARRARGMSVARRHMWTTGEQEWLRQERTSDEVRRFADERGLNYVSVRKYRAGLRKAANLGRRNRSWSSKDMAALSECRDVRAVREFAARRGFPVSTALKYWRRGSV